MAKARILAQKVLYAAYHRLPVAEMSTWQTCQSCMPSDGSWWCFEPSHLQKCGKTNAALNFSPKHSAPSEQNAVYFARMRSGQKNVKTRWALNPDCPGSPKPVTPDDGSVGVDGPSSPARPQLDGCSTTAKAPEGHPARKHQKQP